MKITVITPCFNPGRFLAPMLESVERNKEFVAKHVVMDGGSTDGTVERLAKWADGRSNFVYRSEPDGGQADACRKALELVDTDYFYWLNADDLMLDGALESLAEAAEGDVRFAIVYGDYLRMDGDGTVYAKRRQPSFDYWDCLHGYITVQNVAAIFNTRMLREAGGFDPSLRFAMDYDIVLKLAGMGPVRHVRRFCGCFRVHETSKTSTMDEVCRSETERLRTVYGVNGNAFARFVLHKIAKLRVSLRMLREGILFDRICGGRALPAGLSSVPSK